MKVLQYRTFSTFLLSMAQVLPFLIWPLFLTYQPVSDIGLPWNFQLPQLGVQRNAGCSILRSRSMLAPTWRIKSSGFRILVPRSCWLLEEDVVSRQKLGEPKRLLLKLPLSMITRMAPWWQVMIISFARELSLTCLLMSSSHLCRVSVKFMWLLISLDFVWWCKYCCDL